MTSLVAPLLAQQKWLMVTKVPQMIHREVLHQLQMSTMRSRRCRHSSFDLLLKKWLLFSFSRKSASDLQSCGAVYS